MTVPGSFGIGGFGADPAEVSGFQSIGIAYEGDDFGVVDEPIDHGGSDNLVAEDFAPAVDSASVKPTNALDTFRSVTPAILSAAGAVSRESA